MDQFIAKPFLLLILYKFSLWLIFILLFERRRNKHLEVATAALGHCQSDQFLSLPLALNQSGVSGEKRAR